MNAAPLNILWLCTDQQRYDTLGCCGNPLVRTPNLDRLAQRGVRFDQCFAQSPVCSPSRAAFLTGRYPRTCRERQNGQDIPADERLVTRILAERGYHCGLAGKLHLSACNPSLGRRMEPRIDDGYREFHWSHHDGGGWGSDNEYWRWLAECGREFVNTPHPECEYIARGMPEEFSQTAWCVDRAIDFIGECSRDGAPWLFSVNFFDPHHAFNPPPGALERFAAMIDDLPLPDYVPGELESKPVWQRTDHDGAYGGRGGFRFDGMTERDHRWVRAAYWAMVEVIDRQLGRLFRALEQNGQLEQTLIIFTSDHGEMLGDHGIYLKGPYFYDCAVRVPLLVAGPGVSGGRSSGALVELVDLAPTLLEMTAAPAEPGMQGRSLLPLLAGRTDTHRDSVYSEFYGANFSYQPHAFATMVRTENHKLTVAHRMRTGELYDLTRDRNEHVNQWDNPAYAAVKTEMLLLMTDRMAETCDPLPSRRAMW